MGRLLSYDYIYLVPLTLSVITGILSFFRSSPFPIRFFALFLIITWCVEIFAIAWKWGLYKSVQDDLGPSNMWIYNAFVTIRYICLAFFYNHLLISGMTRKIIVGLSLLTGIAGVLNYTLIQSPHNVNTYTIIMANTITVYFSMAFFRQILIDERIVRLTTSTEVWISLGTFIYYSGTLPFFIFFNYLVTINSPLLRSYLYINDFLNVIMYSLYSIGFLCRPQFLR